MVTDHQPQFRPQPSALDLDLGASCAALLAALPSSSSIPAKASQVLQRWASGQGSSKDTPEKLLDILATLLGRDDELTVAVAVHFRPILLDLAARLLPSEQTPSWESADTLSALHVYATLLAPFPEIYR